jgi:hypothetical protein
MRHLIIPLAFALSCISAQAQNEPSGAAAAAATLIGRTYYACVGAIEPADGIAWGKYDVSASEPLKVTAVQVKNPTQLPGARVTMTMKSSSGRLVTAGAFVEPAGLTEQMIYNAMTGPPSSFGLRAAPPNGGDRSIAKGMRESDVFCMLGAPDHQNDYDGNLQLIYDGGHLIVYTSAQTGLVESVQRFSD